MQKRGSLMQETPVRLLLLVIAIGIVFAVFWRLAVISNEDAEKRICQATLALQASTNFGPKDSAFDTECKRRFIEIRETKVMKIRDGIDVQLPVWADGKVQTSYERLDERIVHGVLAESMRRCWQIGLEGEKAVFNEEFLDSDVVCLVCDQIEISAEGSYGGGTSFTGYLENTQMPVDEKGRTYEQYMFTPKTIDMNLRPDIISGDRECVTRFEIDENPVISKGTYATVLYKYYASTRGGCMATYVVPASKVRTLCERTVN